jgi:S1-C subfamily serine protease
MSCIDVCRLYEYGRLLLRSSTSEHPSLASCPTDRAGVHSITEQRGRAPCGIGRKVAARTATRLAIRAILTAAVPWGAAAPLAAQPAVERLEKQLDQSTQDRNADQTDPGEQSGYLGVLADDRSDQGQGVRILDVVTGGPAAGAGLRAGDVITQIDGRPIASMTDFAALLSESRPEQRMSLLTLRGGRPQERIVTLGRRPQRLEPPAYGGPTAILESRPSPTRRLLGVGTLPVTEEVRQALRLPEARGALVSEVAVGSPADKAGLPLDAVIVACDGAAVVTPGDLVRLVGAAGAGRQVELSYYLRGELVKKKITLSEFAAESAAPPVGSVRQGEPDTVSGRPDGSNAELSERLRRLEERLQRLEALLEHFVPPAAPTADQPAPGET